MDSLLQFEGHLPDIAFPDANNNDDFETSPTSITSKEDKYSLRPRSMRRVTEMMQKNSSSIHQEETQETTKPSKSHKPKQKAAPLSKYRRKTANARERNRMREINQAFEALRKVIPQMAAAHPAPTVNNEKLTKITTLRLAMKYISTLSAVLNGSQEHHHLFLNPEALSDCASDLDCLLLESDGESLPLSDHSLLASPDFPDTSRDFPGSSPDFPNSSPDFQNRSPGFQNRSRDFQSSSPDFQNSSPGFPTSSPGFSNSSPDFPESSLSPVDFGDPTLPSFLHTDFSDHTGLETADFSDFLLT